MSFEIIDGTYRNTGGAGFLIGYKNWDDIVDKMELDGVIESFEVEAMKNDYDGYQLQVDGYDSVNYFLPGNIEAICMHSKTVGGGHCIGLKYSSDTARVDEGDPWGIWFTSDAFYNSRDNDEELVGVDISSSLTNVRETDPLDASLGGQWRLSKW